MPSFEDVIKEFQTKRLEKEINSCEVRKKRTAELQEMAVVADTEMRKRRRSRRKASN